MIPAVRFGRVVGHAGGHDVRAVNGEIVRHLAPNAKDFTMGGNSAIYPRYVPGKEIWVDRDLSPQARACTVLHELIEKWLMLRKRMSYDRAHDHANEVEARLRAELVKDGLHESPLRVAGRWYARWLREVGFGRLPAS